MLWQQQQQWHGPSQRSDEAHRLCIVISRSAPTQHIYKAIGEFKRNPKKKRRRDRERVSVKHPRPTLSPPHDKFASTRQSGVVEVEVEVEVVLVNRRREDLNLPRPCGRCTQPCWCSYIQSVTGRCKSCSADTGPPPLVGRHLRGSRESKDTVSGQAHA